MLGLGPRGRRFESCFPDVTNICVSEKLSVYLIQFFKICLGVEIGRQERLKIFWAESPCRFDSGPRYGYRSLTYKEKQIMDILSFILGMSVVVVIALAVVAVIGLVRVNRVKSQINNIAQYTEKENENIYRNMSEQFNNMHQEFRTDIDNIYRTIDSRFDKLENKINNNASVKTKWHGYESLNK